MPATAGNSTPIAYNDYCEVDENRVLNPNRGSSARSADLDDLGTGITEFAGRPIMGLAAFLVAVLAFAFAAPPVALAQQGPPSRDFIVVLNDQAGPPDFVAEEIAQLHGGRIGFVYDHVLNGFSITLPLTAVAGVESRPDVAYVERDLPMSIVAQEIPTGIDRAFADLAALDMDGVDDWRVDVDVAVVDTGVDFEHPDLNVVGGTDCTLRKSGGRIARYYCGEPGEGTGGDDDYFHGTHVGGTIGALDNGIGVVGVAPGARLWAVKVLNSQGSGYTSVVIAGIDWVVGRGDIEVLNISLGGLGVSTAYKDAIDNAVANGVVVVVAAGNSDADANNYSPAYVPSAITVSALADFDGLVGGLGSPTCRSDEDDTLANFSNWGSAVDIAAPGVCILSTMPVDLDSDGYAIFSGTSMAAPHVAGAAALLASGANAPANAADVAAIRDMLVNGGNFDWTDDSGDGIHEPLLDLAGMSAAMIAMIATDGGGGGENSPPVASFTHDNCVEGQDCNFTDTSTDSDGTIISWAWDFDGDGVTDSDQQNPTHKFLSAAGFVVKLTVIDDGNASDSDTQTVSVSSDGGANADDIALSANGFKEKGLQKADLTWAGATSADVNIFRDGNLIATAPNSSTYTDHINNKGGGSYSYQVCEADTNSCSNNAIVAF